MYSPRLLQTTHAIPSAKCEPRGTQQTGHVRSQVSDLSTCNFSIQYQCIVQQTVDENQENRQLRDIVYQRKSVSSSGFEFVRARVKHNRHNKKCIFVFLSVIRLAEAESEGGKYNPHEL